jgi:bifunctional DNA-binding transcriptional regulator/antitoxin component of YhaV-PrlF toxin-antitoxin module
MGRVRKKIAVKQLSFSTIVKQDDDGELYIELPQELLDQLGWSIGDDLVWIVEEDSKILLRKRTDDSSHEA